MPAPSPAWTVRRSRGGLALALLAGGLVTAPAAAVVIGRPKPVCEEVRRLEGALYVELIDPDGGEPSYTVIDSGSTDPIVLTVGHVYRLGLKMGAGPEAPVIPARYRLEGRSFLTLGAHGAGEGEEALPLEREFSINALQGLLVYARHPGRRRLFLRVSECFEGGGRYLHHPSQTLVPLIVLREAAED